MSPVTRWLLLLCSAAALLLLAAAAWWVRQPGTEGGGGGDQQMVSDLRLSGFDTSGAHDVDHYLYFPTTDAANVVADALRRQRYEVEVAPSESGETWLVLARHRIVPDAVDTDALRDDMEKLAATHGGEYDGWEAGPVK